jgi:hypothetical protein
VGGVLHLAVVGAGMAWAGPPSTLNAVFDLTTAPYFSFTKSKTKIAQTPTVTGNCAACASRRNDPPLGIAKVSKSMATAVSIPRTNFAQLPFLEKLEATMCARSSMTQAEINKEHAAIKPPPPASNEIATPIPDGPKFDFGVIRDERNPSFLEVNPDTGSDYVITAELFIRVQDEVVTVYSGYHKSDPLQGEVYATIPGGGAHFYPTPDTTGPAKLIAVNGTVLTIETIGGTYEQYEAGTGIKTGSVTAKGGSRYEFDLVARSFR